MSERNRENRPPLDKVAFDCIDELRRQRDELLEAAADAASIVSAIMACEGWRESLHNPNGATEWLGPRLYKLETVLEGAIGSAKRAQS